MGKIFIVGPKASYICKGRVYKPGDEIDGDYFKKESLEAAIKGGHLTDKGKTPAPRGDGKKNLDEMTLMELRDYAAEKKISVTENKAEVLAAIKDAEAKTPAGGETVGKFDALSDSDLIAFAADKGIDPGLGREKIIEALKALGSGN